MMPWCHAKVRGLQEPNRTSSKRLPNPYLGTFLGSHEASKLWRENFLNRFTTSWKAEDLCPSIPIAWAQAGQRLRINRADKQSKPLLSPSWDMRSRKSPNLKLSMCSDPVFRTLLLAYTMATKLLIAKCLCRKGWQKWQMIQMIQMIWYDLLFHFDELSVPVQGLCQTLLSHGLRTGTKRTARAPLRHFANPFAVLKLGSLRGGALPSLPSLRASSEHHSCKLCM